MTPRLYCLILHQYSVSGQCNTSKSENLMGEAKNRAKRLDFDAHLRLEFQGAKVTTDGGLLVVRELDEACSVNRSTQGRRQEGHPGHGFIGIPSPRWSGTRESCIRRWASSRRASTPWPGPARREDAPMPASRSATSCSPYVSAVSAAAFLRQVRLRRSA